MAGKIIRKSQDNIAQLISKITGSDSIVSDEDTPILGSIIEDKKCSYASSIENAQSFSLEKNVSKIPIYPRISNKKKEKGILILVKLAYKKMNFWYSMIIKNAKCLDKLSSFLKKILTNRFKLVLELLTSFDDDSKEFTNRSRDKSSRESFKGCIQNIKNFINDKREKKKSILSQKKINLESIEFCLLKLSINIEKSIVKEYFQEIIKNSGFFVLQFSNQVEKVLNVYKIKYARLAFNSIRDYQMLIKKYSRTIKSLVINLSKDFIYRLSTCFKY